MAVSRVAARSQTVLALVGGLVAVALVSTVAVAGVAAWQLTNDLGPGVDIGQEGEPLPQTGPIDGAVNILLVGSDSGGGNKAYGTRGETLNDVTILLHISPVSHTATAVSFPRDLLVPIPSCPKEDGSGNYAAMSRQKINVSLSYGGLRCTVMTVEKLTGLEIPYAAKIEFDGVIAMSTAVGGVDVCLATPIKDHQVGLDLPAGTVNARGLARPPVPAQPLRRRRRQRPQPDQQPAGVPVGAHPQDQERRGADQPAHALLDRQGRDAEHAAQHDR